MLTKRRRMWCWLKEGPTECRRLLFLLNKGKYGAAWKCGAAWMKESVMLPEWRRACSWLNEGQFCLPHTGDFFSDWMKESVVLSKWRDVFTKWRRMLCFLNEIRCCALLNAGTIAPTERRRVCCGLIEGDLCLLNDEDYCIVWMK